MNSYIVININSDLEPVVWPTDTDTEIYAARAALRDAGLEYAFVWAGDAKDPDSYRTDSKLFAASAHDEETP